MHTIIKKIIKKQGQDVITSKILVNCIDDEGGFSDVEMRPYKKILKLIIEEDYSRKLLEIGAWNAEAEMLARTCAQRSLIQEEGVLYVFACLAYGLGWLSKAPKVPAEVKKIKQQEAKKEAEENEAARKKAETESRQKEEAARKKAEIAEKRALEAERRAKDAEKKALEAEAARKKAEKEAKEKAADAVVALIRAIGVVEYTDACRKKIEAAKQAYTKLTADQKKLVENADVIAASEKEYDRLKIAAEKAAEAARKKAEKEAKEVRKKAEYEAKKAKHEKISVKLKEYCVENDNSISTTWGTFRISNIKPADLWEFLQSKKDGQFKILTKEIEYTIKANASDEVDIKKHHFNISSKEEAKSASSPKTLPQKVKKADYDTYRALLNEGKQPETGIIGRIEKIFNIGFFVLWAFFLIVNAIYTWGANSWLSCIIWVIITIAVFFGIMSLIQNDDEPKSIARLAGKICVALGLSVICEIIMMVIFAS